MVLPVKLLSPFSAITLAISESGSQAREQAERYRAALVKREGDLDLRTYAVVAVGLERMLGEEIVGA